MEDRKASKLVTEGRSSSSTRSAAKKRIVELVEREPRFKALAKVARGDEWELTQEQQTFLDDFAAQITRSLAESNESLKD